MNDKWNLSGKKRPDARRPDEMTVEELRETYGDAIEAANKVAEAVVHMADAGLRQAMEVADAMRSLVYANAAQLNQWAETMALAVKDLEERHRRLQEEAVFAAEWSWTLLEDFATEDEGVPPYTDAIALVAVLEREHSKGDSLAGELLAAGKQQEEGLPRFTEGAPLRRFIEEVRRHVGVMREAIGMGDDADLPKTEEDAARRAPGDGEPVLWIDERFAQWLEQSFSKTGAELAAAVRRGSRARWKRIESHEGDKPVNGRLFGLWIDMEADPDDRRRGDLFPFRQILAVAVWQEIVRPELEAERRGLTARVVVLGKEGDRDQYAGIQKAIAPVAWAFGGEGNFVDIGDGDQYAATPDAPKVAIVPRSMEILVDADGKFSPRQGALPLHYPGDDPLVWAIVKQARGGRSEATEALPSAHAGKLALVTLACTLDPGQPASTAATATGTLEQWTKAINPDVRYIQKTHRKAAARGMIEMEAMVAVDPANHSRVRCFDMQVPLDPDRPRKETVVEAKMGGLFSETIWRQRALETGRRDSFSGYFVINLTGAMRLDVRRPSLLRHYIRSAMAWNDAHGIGGGAGFMRERLPWTPLDDWLAIVNQLGQRAVDLRKERKGSGSRYQGLHESRKKGRQDLERLYEEAKLIELEIRGRRGKQEIRTLPTEGIVEAWEGFARKARRRKV